MPKIFGLSLRDIVSTPGKLKLDADPIKLSPTTSKRRKFASFRSSKLLKRLSKQSKTSTNTRDMRQSGERARSIDQRISDLSALLVSMEGTDVGDRYSGLILRQNASPEYDWTADIPADENRSSGFRRRTALRSIIFDPPITPAHSAECL